MPKTATPRVTKRPVGRPRLFGPAQSHQLAVRLDPVTARQLAHYADSLDLGVSASSAARSLITEGLTAKGFMAK